MATIYLQNARSIRNKFTEIETIPLTNNNPEIIAITETWLQKTEENLYTIKGYNSIYNSRESRAGGIALYIKENIPFKVLINKTIRRIEILSIETEENKVAITLIYRPPQADFKDLLHVMKNNILCRQKNRLY